MTPQCSSAREIRAANRSHGNKGALCSPDGRSALQMTGPRYQRNRTKSSGRSFGGSRSLNFGEFTPWCLSSGWAMRPLLFSLASSSGKRAMGPFVHAERQRCAGGASGGECSIWGCHGLTSPREGCPAGLGVLGRLRRHTGAPPALGTGGSRGSCCRCKCWALS